MRDNYLVFLTDPSSQVTPGECVLLRRVCTNDIILMTCVASTAFRSIPGKVLESEMQELFNHTVDPVRAFQ